MPNRTVPDLCRVQKEQKLIGMADGGSVGPSSSSLSALPLSPYSSLSSSASPPPSFSLPSPPSPPLLIPRCAVRHCAQPLIKAPSPGHRRPWTGRRMREAPRISCILYLVVCSGCRATHSMGRPRAHPSSGRTWGRRRSPPSVAPIRGKTPRPS